MKDLLIKFVAWMKRNVAGIIEHAVLFAVFALVAWQVRSAGDWLMACAAWLFVEGVLAYIKGKAA